MLYDSNMLSAVVILLLGSVLGKRPPLQECSNYEFRCVNGNCIPREYWCDGESHCRDNSDEYFCTGRALCMKGFFRCTNGRCIPKSGLCDEIDDCKDGSDESSLTCLDASRSAVPVVNVLLDVPEVSYPSENVQNEYSSTVKRAVASAANYLLSERHSDYGWGGAIPTSRAIVALAFAESVQKIDVHEMKLMKKYLNIQLSLDLIPGTQKTSLSHLALFINALYATCQDPRNFQGMDLVDLLRSKTAVSMNSNFTLPFVLLTLCVANVNIDPYKQQLEVMYRTSSDRMSSKALTIMAMVCLRGRSDNLESRDFFSKLRSEKDVKSDVYTKALIMQASNAMKRSIDPSQLLTYQQKNGSFGDLLATYYAIPALLSTSMLELKCKSMEQYEGILGKSFSKAGHEAKRIKYSLWMAPDTDADTHSMAISYEGNKSFYDIMRIAASRDATFSFMYDEKDGKKVYSVAGIPNDVEAGMFWTLYRANTDMVSRNSKENLKEEIEGVDKIFPRENEHFIFWLKRS